MPRLNKNQIKLLIQQKEPVLLLGLNKHSSKLDSLLNVAGFIDDFSKKREWRGKKIFRTNEIDSSVVISCSIAIQPITALENLEKKNLPFCHYLDVIDFLPESLKENDFFYRMMYDQQQNKTKYDALFKQLSDEKSKIILKKILKFRKERDINSLRGFHVDLKSQYFLEFINLKNEIMVDAGGFDGDTAAEFTKRCPDYEEIHLFEPDSNNLSKAKERLKENKNISFYNKGLSNKREILSFDSGKGSASIISENGKDTIEVDKLDDLVKSKVSFIKMDIEGAESAAIEGAKRHIIENHPKLAIAVYHKPDDLWRIPDQVLKIRDDYDLYLRHYTEGTDETIMYFIPK